MANDLTQYASLVSDIKNRIGQAQTRAAFSANREMLALYWDIGRLITERQAKEGWGAAVIPRLSKDLRNELPGLRGFSEQNLNLMLRFYREYPALFYELHHTVKGPEQSDRELILHQAVTKSQVVTDEYLTAVCELVPQIPWGHNVLLIRRFNNVEVRLWYMQQTIEQGWSRNILQQMIKSGVHLRQGKTITNFEAPLPAPQSDLALQTLKDPYIFDFLTLDTTFREKELEAGLLRHLQQFLLELGKGFSFVGRQVPLTLGEDEFHVDLLFYHLRLRCFVVVELKAGPFKPDYAGKMNFYLNVVDDQLKHRTDNPSIGLILCKDKRKIVAEYSLRGIEKPIGISEYELTQALPDELNSSLPTVEEIEQSLGPLSGNVPVSQVNIKDKDMKEDS